MKTALYRHYDKIGTLLYVGISSSVGSRTGQHCKGARWADIIARIEVEYYETREGAAAAELEAIRREKPVYNIVGQGAKCRASWAVLDLNEGWADGWYTNYTDMPDMLDFYRAAFPEAALVLVPWHQDENEIVRLCRQCIRRGRMFRDHPEYYERWQNAENRTQKNAS